LKFFGIVEYFFGIFEECLEFFGIVEYFFEIFEYFLKILINFYKI
jgi:hypothetical protein